MNNGLSKARPTGRVTSSRASSKVVTKETAMTDYNREPSQKALMDGSGNSNTSDDKKPEATRKKEPEPPTVPTKFATAAPHPPPAAFNTTKTAASLGKSRGPPRRTKSREPDVAKVVAVGASAASHEPTIATARHSFTHHNSQPASAMHTARVRRSFNSIHQPPATSTSSMDMATSKSRGPARRSTSMTKQKSNTMLDYGLLTQDPSDLMNLASEPVAILEPSSSASLARSASNRDSNNNNNNSPNHQSPIPSDGASDNKNNTTSSSYPTSSTSKARPRGLSSNSRTAVASVSGDDAGNMKKTLSSNNNSKSSAKTRPAGLRASIDAAPVPEPTVLRPSVSMSSSATNTTRGSMRMDNSHQNVSNQNLAKSRPAGLRTTSVGVALPAESTMIPQPTVLRQSISASSRSATTRGSMRAENNHVVADQGMNKARPAGLRNNNSHRSSDTSTAGPRDSTSSNPSGDLANNNSDNANSRPATIRGEARQLSNASSTGPTMMTDPPILQPSLSRGLSKGRPGDDGQRRQSTMTVPASTPSVGLSKGRPGEDGSRRSTIISSTTTAGDDGQTPKEAAVIGKIRRLQEKNQGGSESSESSNEPSSFVDEPNDSTADARKDNANSALSTGKFRRPAPSSSIPPPESAPTSSNIDKVHAMLQRDGSLRGQIGAFLDPRPPINAPELSADIDQQDGDKMREVEVMLSRDGSLRGQIGAFLDPRAPINAPALSSDLDQSSKHKAYNDGDNLSSKSPKGSMMLEKSSSLRQKNGDLEKGKMEEDLAVARAVTEESDHDVVGEATMFDEMMHKQQQASKRRVFRIHLGSAFIIILAFILLILWGADVFEKGEDTIVEIYVTAEPSEEPTMTPTQAPTPYAVTLPDFTLESLDDPDSPQSQAYRWLRDDPWLDSYPEARLQQRFALAAFYYATNGWNWTINDSWLSYEVSECDWHSKWINQGTNPPICGSLTVTDEDEEENSWQYQSLILTLNGLSGSLVPELALLSNLKVFDIADNSVEGSIPVEVTSLEYLQEIAIDANYLSGSIHTEFGRLTKLGTFLVHTNLLTSTVPTELGLMTKLSHLEFQSAYRDTKLTGTLPSELGLLTNLTLFSCHANNLSGGLPEEIWNLTNLDLYLQLQENNFTGTLSSRIGQLSNLQFMGIHHNLLSGSLPSEVGLMTSLTELDLATNYLEEMIPSTLGSMTGLRSLFLQQNYFTAIPSEIGLATNLVVVDIGENNLSNSSIPSEIAELRSLEELFLYLNDLSGSVPSQLGLLGSLISLDLESNQLSSSIPVELFQMSSLEWLWLSDNSIAGTISSEIGRLTSVQSLKLSSSLLYGFLPSELGLLTALTDLLLSDISLTRSIPSELGLLAALRQLDFQATYLTGTIPSQLTDLGSLELMAINSTFLTGIIPPGLCNVADLSFDCSDQLCGCDCDCSTL